jgi:hypothetical protein
MFVQLEHHVCHSQGDRRQIVLNGVPRTLKVVPKTCFFVQKAVKVVQHEVMSVQLK